MSLFKNCLNIVRHLGKSYPFINNYRIKFASLMAQDVVSSKAKFHLLELYKVIPNFIADDDHVDLFETCSHLLPRKSVILMKYELSDFHSVQFVSRFYKKSVNEMITDFEFVRAKLPSVDIFPEHIASQLQPLITKYIGSVAVNCLTTVWLRNRFQNISDKFPTYASIEKLVEMELDRNTLPINPATCPQVFATLDENSRTSIIPVLEEERLVIRPVIDRLRVMSVTELQDYVGRAPDIQQFIDPTQITNFRTIFENLGGHLYLYLVGSIEESKTETSMVRPELCLDRVLMGYNQRLVIEV